MAGMDAARIAEIKAKVAAAKAAQTAQAGEIKTPAAQALEASGPVRVYHTPTGGTVRVRDIHIPRGARARVGLLLSVLGSIVAMSLVWLLNGLSTVWIGSVPLRSVVGFVDGLVHSINPEAPEIALSITSVWVTLGIAHVVISMIEQHLWRARVRILYVLIVIVGVVDVLSASLMVMLFFGWFTHPVWSCALGMAIALTPEMVIARLFRVLVAFVRAYRG